MFRIAQTRPGRTSRRVPRSRFLGTVEPLEGRSLLATNGWAFGVGGPSSNLYNQFNHADVDSAGNLYVTGAFNGTVDFDPSDSSHTDTAAILTSGDSGADQDTVVAKYGPNGSFLWAHHIGGSDGGGRNSGLGIVFQDLSGVQSVYVTGQFYGTVDFSGTNTAVRTSAGSDDAFVTRLDASTGKLIWANTLGGTGDDQGQGLALDGQGNAYVTGWFNGTAHFGPSLTLTTASGSASTAPDAFVARLDGVDGHVVWAKSGGGSGSDKGYGVAVSPDSTSVIVTGTIGYGTATFGTVSLPGVTTPNNSATAAFLWDLHAADGTTAWAEEMAPSANSYTFGNSSLAYGIATDPAGNLYLTGGFNGTVNFGNGTTLTNFAMNPSNALTYESFVEKLTPSGALVWVQGLGTPAGGSIGHEVRVDDQRDVYSAGFFAGVADFDPGPGKFTLTSAPAYSRNGYLWELDPSGNFRAAWGIGSSSASVNQFAYDVVPYRDSTGAPALYAVGMFAGTASFPTGTTLTSAGGTGAFALKLDPRLGSLTGNVFNDLNNNGLSDEAAPLKGWTVFLDQNQNGVLNPGEVTTTTDSQGNYLFSNLAPGSYSIAMVPPAGYTQTAPTATTAGTYTANGQVGRVVTLVAGQSGDSLDFGEYTPNQVKTYSNTNVLKLPNTSYNAITTSTLTIADSYSILDLNVRLNMTQQDDTQPTVDLIGPDGTLVRLLYVPGPGSNFTNTTFDDAATTPINAGTAPYTGTYRPEGLLNAFDGENVHGTWTLKIYDNGRNNTLNSWSLIVTGPKPAGTFAAMAAQPVAVAPMPSPTAPSGATLLPAGTGAVSLSRTAGNDPASVPARIGRAPTTVRPKVAQPVRPDAVDAVLGGDLGHLITGRRRALPRVVPV